MAHFDQPVAHAGHIQRAVVHHLLDTFPQATIALVDGLDRVALVVAEHETGRADDLVALDAVALHFSGVHGADQRLFAV